MRQRTIYVIVAGQQPSRFDCLLSAWRDYRRAEAEVERLEREAGEEEVYRVVEVTLQ